MRHEEVTAVGRIQAGARVVLDAGRAVLDVADRGHDVRGLAGVARVPDLFGVPRARLAERRELVTDAPAAVAALDDVHEPLLVAVVAVIVAGEEVAEFVEDERLRVAEAGGEKFETRAVGVAAEHRALVGHRQRRAFLGPDRRAAVAVAEVDLPVGAEHEAVQVVAGEVEAHAVAAADLGAALGAVSALEPPDARDVGEPHLAAPSEDARADAVEGRVEAVRVDHAAVGAAVAVGVLHQPHDLALDGEFLFAGGAESAADQRGAVLDGAARELVLEHPHVVADIEHAAAVAVGLGDEDAALLVEGERDRVGEHRLGGPEAGLEAGGQTHAFQGLLALVGGRRDVGCGLAGAGIADAAAIRRAVLVVGIGGAERGGGQEGREQRGAKETVGGHGEGRGA